MTCSTLFAVGHVTASATRPLVCQRTRERSANGGPGMPAEVDSRILTAHRVGGTVWTGAQLVDRHNLWGTLADAGATLAVGVCVVIVAMVLQATSVEAMSFSDSLPRGLFTP